MKHYKHYINGEFTEGSEKFETLDPANGRPWATFPAASEQESNLAIESAHSALYKGAWSKLTATQRGKLVHKLSLIHI